MFRAALADGAQMCLCGALAATPGLLSEPVVEEVRRFFTTGTAHLKAHGVAEAQAIRVLATLEGAILMATVQNDPAVFEHATSALSG